METNVAELGKEINREARDEQVPPPRNGAPGGLANPRTRRALLLGAIAIGLVVVSLVVHYYGRVTTDDAQVDGHITAVSSKVYGNVIEVLVNDNQPVKAGQVLRSRLDGWWP